MAQRVEKSDGDRPAVEVDPKSPQSLARTERLFSPGFGAYIKVGVCYQTASRVLAARMRPLEITVAQFDVLANLYMHEGITQKELAERLLVTKGNVTGLVNRLADRKLVKRAADPTDRRANRLVLTRKGQRIAERALVIQRNFVDEMMQAFSTEENELLRRLLTRLADVIEAEDR